MSACGIVYGDGVLDHIIVDGHIPGVSARQHSTLETLIQLVNRRYMYKGHPQGPSLVLSFKRNPKLICSYTSDPGG